MDANLNKTTDGPPNFALIKKPFVPRKSTSDTDRRHIVKAYLNGGLPRTISDMFGIKLSTVYGIIKNYRNTGKVAAIRRGGNHKKILSPEAAQSVRNWLNEDNTLSLKQLAQKVWEQYHIHVSPSTVAREIRTLRAALQRRKLALQAKKWNNYIATAGIEALHSNDDSIAEDQSATFVKEEDLSSSDDNEQCADDIDIGETVLTHTDGWDQTVESYKSEGNPLEEIIINESDLSETLMVTGKKISCDSMAKVIRAEKRLIAIDTDQPNVNHIVTSLSGQPQPDSNESHISLDSKTTEKCTFTMHMLDEPQTMKTITVSMPKSPAANDHSFDNLTKTNVANAPTTCTHCTCFHELVSEQKKMLALFSTFEKKIVDGMQQMQETLTHKLKQIEEIIKDSNN